MWWIENIDALIMLAGAILGSLWAWRIFDGKRPDSGLLNDRNEPTRRRLKRIAPLLGVGAILLILTKANRAEHWAEFTPDDRMFSIMLPSPPKYTERVEEDGIGPVKSLIWSSTLKPKSVTYVINLKEKYANLSYGLEAELAEYTERLTGMGYKFHQRTERQISGYKATSLDANFPDGRAATVLILWTGKHQYILMRACEPGTALTEDKFFSSFKVNTP